MARSDIRTGDPESYESDTLTTRPLTHDDDDDNDMTIMMYADLGHKLDQMVFIGGCLCS